MTDNAKASDKRWPTHLEFALTLPLILVLIFGIIELTRIFQAWIILQNSAGAAIEAGVSRAWQSENVARRLPGVTDDRLQILDEWIPCTPDANLTFWQHWGKDCDPTSPDDLMLREDMARLLWIVDNARQKADSLELAPGEWIPGLQGYQGNEINTYAAITSDSPGWFHVWICSHRHKITGNPDELRYLADLKNPDSDSALCRVQETSDYGPVMNSNQYDAGGTGDILEVVVYYNLPLITPLAVVDHIRLTARQTGVNEAPHTP